MYYVVPLPTTLSPPTALLELGTLVGSGARRELRFRDRFNAVKAALLLGRPCTVREVPR